MRLQMFSSLVLNELPTTQRAFANADTRAELVHVRDDENGRLSDCIFTMLKAVNLPTSW